MFALRPKAAVLAGAAAIALSLFSPGKSAHACSEQSFIGTLCLFGSNQTINGYLIAQGQQLALTGVYANLYAIIGSIYGGDGRTYFTLPDLRGRMPIGYGHGPGLSNRSIGQKGGSETVTQSVDQMAIHTHALAVRAQSGTAATTAPKDAVWADSGRSAYSTAAPNVDMLAGAVTIATTGGTNSMNIMQPYLTLNWLIAYEGAFPW